MQQKKPHSSPSPSSDSSNIPNTPPSKRPRTTVAPQPPVSSSANNTNLSVQKQNQKKPIVAAEESNKKSNGESEEEEEEEEDTSSRSSSSQSLPPENKGMEKNAKKQLFQRVFSAEDEIILLEGLFNFRKNAGGDDSASGMINMIGFHEFIKGSFQSSFTKPQLSDKIKRLKKRFRRNKGRVFKSDTHDKQIFELSNKLWGVKKSTMQKSVDHFCLCKFGFNGDVYARFQDFAPNISGIMAECGPTMKKKLIDLQIKGCELKIAHNLVENEKIQLIMDYLKSQSQ
ncbi:hypothetical protein V6N12_013173 [Hibiscus sabdariffa]|uniref:Glabrous enhancer-binding protein-like DBD domain-containing protein n=1 Tax=Hibiscus sabdariffa TaxID=183260 RepID=A0ABR2D5R7_9ROSI